MEFERLDEDRWAAKITWENGKTDYHVMPEGYDPNEDRGESAVLELLNEHFLDHA